MEVKMAQKKVYDKEFKVQAVKLGREIGFSKEAKEGRLDLGPEKGKDRVLLLRAPCFSAGILLLLKAPESPLEILEQQEYLHSKWRASSDTHETTAL